jgi:uncharacterized damage-inducible protein DinB
MDLIDRLLEHDHWATSTLLNICENLTAAQLDQEFDIGHQTIRQTLGHMLFNYAFWTGLMVGKPTDSNRQDEQTDWSVAALTELFEQDQARFAATARSIRDEQRLYDTFSDHYNLPCSFAGTIIQVCMHNEVHRSEVLHILQRLGVPDVPELDHSLWDHSANGD